MKKINSQEFQDDDLPHSILRADIKLTGDLFFSGVLHIFGNVTGNIISSDESNSHLILEKDSEVNGEVRASNISIYSKISGNIFAFNRLNLKSSANIQGDIHYRELEMSEGATINGALSTLDPVDT